MTHQEQVKSFFNKTEFYLHKPFGVRARALIANRMLKHISQQHILDIGCGDGGVSLQFLDTKNRLTLIDLAENMLTLARQKCDTEQVRRVTFINQDFLSYKPESGYDVVLCFGVLAHVPDIDAAVKQLAKLLRSGGVCLVQFTDQDKMISRLQRMIHNLHSRHGNSGYEVSLMSISKMITLVEENGLQLVDHVRYSLLIPGMGRLPDEWLYRYQVFTLENDWLARHGTEVVMKLVKPEINPVIVKNRPGDAT